MSKHRRAERIPGAVGAVWALATLAGAVYLQRPYAGAPGGMVQAGTVVASEPAISKQGGTRSTSLHSPATPQLVRGWQSLRFESAPQATGRIAGEVADETPQALVGTARQAKETLLKVKDDVYWEDVIRTLDTGRVRVQLRDGSRLNIGVRSAMRIVKHDPQSQQTEIELTLGRIRGEVMKLTKPGGVFEVKTPTAVLGVVGTILLVDAHDSFTQVCAAEGSVKVRNVNPAVPGEKILHAGECARVDQGQAPSDVVNPAPVISMLTQLTDVPDPVAALVAGCSTNVSAERREMEERTRVLVNEVRKKLGLRELAWNDTLADVARQHSCRMMALDFLEHVDPDFGEVSQRLRAAGVDTTSVGENVFKEKGHDDPAGYAVGKWTTSPHHYANMVEPSFAASGVGIAVSAEGEYSFTQIFSAVIPTGAATAPHP
jgi:uncharacterized protein YkwD